jgi:beta-galactosidase GanA
MPIWCGGDYNPEQWCEGVWPEAVRPMRRARVTTATMGVFSWARLEPREGEYNIRWLDRQTCYRASRYTQRPSTRRNRLFSSWEPRCPSAT